MRFMMKQLHQKRGGRSFKLGGTRLLLATVLLCIMPTMALAEETIPTVSDAKTAPCKGLKPFNNLDELLCQFYINLDSDCLFTMPAAELEQKWDIKILSKERCDAGQFNASDFGLKTYKSDNDAFYVEIYRRENMDKNTFYIKMTKDFYNKEATLFPDGKFPKLLPPPLQLLKSSTRPGLTSSDIEPPRPTIQGVYSMQDYHYYWLNSKATSMILLQGYYGVDEVEIMNYVPPAFERKAREAIE